MSKIFSALIFSLSLLQTQFSFAEFYETSNSINNKSIQFNDSINMYSFFVSGHFHGSSNNTSGKPAKTLIYNLEKINSTDVLFLMCLGDLFLDIKNDIPTYKKHFIGKLKFPLFNSPGNHDKSGNIYERNFGKTYYTFRVKSELFIILDTELDDGSILDMQLKMLENVLHDLKGIKNIFVFSHRLIWAEEHPSMLHLFADNTRSTNGNNFRKTVLPKFEKLPKDKKIYFMGGSLGNAPSPFFYYQEKNIFYIATAIRDTPKDAFLKVIVNKGAISFESFPLVMPIEFYNLDYYQGKYNKPPGFNWRLIPLYLKTMFFHRYFWYGIFWVMMLIASIYFIRKKRRVNR